MDGYLDRLTECVQGKMPFGGQSGSTALALSQDMESQGVTGRIRHDIKLDSEWP